jgi:hypothetical protein
MRTAGFCDWRRLSDSTDAHALVSHGGKTRLTACGQRLDRDRLVDITAEEINSDEVRGCIDCEETTGYTILGKDVDE